MTALPHHMAMTVEEYLQLDRNSHETRYEYSDGHIRMLAGGSLDHATIGLNVASTLRAALRDSPCRVFNSDARVQLSETRYVYPDATVSCGEQEHGQNDTVLSPRLVIEVLSPSTEGYDRGKKFWLYRQCPTLQEYVLINTLRPEVEVYRRGKNNLWTLYTFELHEDVELLSLNLHFPVTAFYEDVVFRPEEPEIP
ncbi:MAG: Uma2 family endonuclease [Ktedonobacteraceae bacterium]